MAKCKLDKIRTVYYCSSSIANFRDKLHKRLGLEVWQWWKNRNDRVIFFGLYHWKDYLRFIWHRGQKKVFWCGSDILALEDRPIWQSLIRNSTAKHYCENHVEEYHLSSMGIIAFIEPMIFDDPNKFKISYKWSKKPKFFASYHSGREIEYNWHNNPQVDFLEGLSEQQFNEKIKSYQGAVRYNRFDGFAETLAKSVLMGQYPFSQIEYPHIFSMTEKVNSLPKQPNYEGRKYWLKVFQESLKELCEHW